MEIACIIDDDPIQVLLAERMLYKQKLCKRLYVFRNGREALNNLKTIANDPAMFPDVIFLDINMPVLDGWGFLEEFKILKPQIKKNIQLFMLSSSVWQEDIDKAHNYPEVTDYLLKPVTMELLARTMTISEDVLGQK
jgi:CheY-like chemotaxis protein